MGLCSWLYLWTPLLYIVCHYQRWCFLHKIMSLQLVKYPHGGSKYYLISEKSRVLLLNWYHCIPSTTIWVRFQLDSAVITEVGIFEHVIYPCVWLQFIQCSVFFYVKGKIAFWANGCSLPWYFWPSMLLHWNIANVMTAGHLFTIISWNGFTFVSEATCIP